MKFFIYFFIFLTIIIKNYKVECQQGPVFIHRPQSQTGLTKGNLVLFCKGTGGNKLKIKWFRDDREISTGMNRYTIRGPSKGSTINSTLWITEARKRKENARFKCVLSNEYGVIESVAQITIIDDEDKPDGFPVIKTGPTVKTVEKKRDESMLCIASGNPLPSIRWYKGFFPLVEKDRIRVSTDTTSDTIKGMLTIINSTFSDVAKYHCIAENQLGTVISNGANLFVKERREKCAIKTGPNRFYEVSPGDDLNITCAAAGFPMPEVTWYKQNVDNQLIQVGNRVQGINRLFLTNIQFPSNYTCIAQSILNKDTATTEIRLQRLPETPTNLKEVPGSKTSRSLRVQWDYIPKYGVASTDLYFKIFYRPIDNARSGNRTGSRDYIIIDHISSQSYIVTDLRPHTHYELRVGANNRIGGSDLSPNFFFITNEAAPERPPENVIAVLTSRMAPTEIFVQYSEPSLLRNGHITGAIIYYTKNAETLPQLEDWMSKNSSESSGTIGGLLVNQVYAICVASTNRAGIGPPSRPFMIQTTFGVPTQPRNFDGEAESKNAIRVHWKSSSSSLNQSSTSYIILFRCVTCKTEQRVVVKGAEEFKVDSLHPNTAYLFRIAARVDDVTGVTSRPIRISTHAGAPTAPPSDVRVSTLDASTVEVTWSPVMTSQMNGELRWYSVYIQRLNVENEAVGNEKKMTCMETRYVAKQLRPYSIYHFRVSASTQVGEGPKSAHVVITTDESKPGVGPSNITASAINSSSVLFRWLPIPVASSNGKITSYDIIYRESLTLEEEHLNKKSKLMYANLKVDDVTTDDDGFMMYTLKGLEVKTCYKYSMCAATREGSGSTSAEQSVCTKGIVPKVPQLSVSKTTGNEALVTWKANDLSISNYLNWQLRYRCVTPTKCGDDWISRFFDVTTNRYIPNDVYPGWTYTFQLTATNSEGTGQPASKTISLPAMKPDAPPQNLQAKIHLIKPQSGIHTTPYVIDLSWDPLPYHLSNGPTIGYQLEWSSLDPLTSSETIDVTTEFYRFKNVQISEKYQFQVSAKNEGGLSRLSNKIEVLVSPPKPVCPNVTLTGLEVTQASSNSTWLRWNPLGSDLVHKFIVTTRISGEISGKFIERSETYETNFKISNLKEGTIYNFTVTISINDDSSDASCDDVLTYMVSGKTTQKMVIPTPVVTIENHRAIVTLSRPTNHNLLTEYFIVVVPTNQSGIINFLPDAISQNELMGASQTLRRRRSLKKMPYITARFNVLGLHKLIELGDQINYGSIVNKPISPGFYRVFMRAILDPKTLQFVSSEFSELFEINPDKVSPTSSNDKIVKEEGLVWIVAPITAALVILILILGIVFYKKRKIGEQNPRNRNNFKFDDSYSNIDMKNLNNSHLHQPLLNNRVEHDPVDIRRQKCTNSAMTSRPPINTLHFKDHVMQLRANDNLKFAQEYQTIDPGQQFKWEHSRLEDNKTKNRYANVVAYDHTRVILSSIEGIPGSDYINANYVSGFRKENAYIATQGPTKNTFHDFWRMIWEQRSSVIVMMTKCEEKGKIKCDQYWPSLETNESYEEISVQTTEETQLATFICRTFLVSKIGYEKQREVRHFQFTAWPDHAVPEHATSVLSFIKRVKSNCTTEMGPIVVHCSAGVGRAGCFICIDAQLERIKSEKTIDIYGQVTCMRAERNYMVQSEDQYIFIHDSLLEAVTSGNTEIQARDLFNHLRDLTRAEGDNEVTKMEAEFKGLSGPKATPTCFVSAYSAANKFKNRLVNILPLESSRVPLAPVSGVEGSDYINASFIDGYRSVT